MHENVHTKYFSDFISHNKSCNTECDLRFNYRYKISTCIKISPNCQFMQIVEQDIFTPWAVLQLHQGQWQCFLSHYTLSMHFHKFSEVKFGVFQHFHFTDENIVKGINSLAGFFNVLANSVWDSVQKRRKIITAMCNGNKTFKINKCIHLGHTWFLGNEVLANIH